MAENILPFVARDAGAAALVDERGVTSWQDFNERVNRLIHVLRGAGLGKGSAVAILAGNRREYFEIASACSHAAMVAVPINWHFVAEEVAYVLENSDASALVVGDRFAELGRAALDRLAGSSRSLGLAMVMGGPDGGPREAPPGFVLYEEILAGAPSAEPDDQGQGGVMFYTSGTTGRPKGVRRRGELGGPLGPQRMRAEGLSAAFRIPSDGVTLVCGPLYHSAQWAFSVFPLDAGSRMVTTHKFDAATTLELIDRYRVTNVHLVPTQFIRLLRLPDERRAAFDGGSLQQVLHGAAPCPPEVKRSMIEWWGPVITEYYGGTEAGVISMINATDWLERPTSLGRPLPFVEVTVRDEQGQPCPTGTAGQIYLTVQSMPGFEYHKNPEETARVHRGDAEFTLGDIGFLDEDGFIHLTDRKIDMIISGGVNIYPAEIERVLGDHEAVEDVAVFGVPNEEYGEEVKAVVVPTPGHAADETLRARLHAHCREHLAGYKVPRTIDFRSELPRQATGKLQKRTLRDRYWEGLERKI